MTDTRPPRARSPPHHIDPNPGHVTVRHGSASSPRPTRLELSHVWRGLERCKVISVRMRGLAYRARSTVARMTASSILWV